jgi:hypothetical protein
MKVRARDSWKKSSLHRQKSHRRTEGVLRGNFRCVDGGSFTDKALGEGVADLDLEKRSFREKVRRKGFRRCSSTHG